MQEFGFVDNHRVFWFLGALVLLVGLLAALLIVLSIGQVPDIGGPDIRFPKMGILPAQDAPTMPVQANHDHETHP